jgi:hypothetical protein
MAPETMMGGSAKEVVVLALLSAVVGSGVLLVTEAASLTVPSSMA